MRKKLAFPESLPIDPQISDLREERELFHCLLLQSLLQSQENQTSGPEPTSSEAILVLPSPE